MPAERYDNHVIDDRIEVVAPEWLGTDQPVAVYRARRDGQPVALFATPTAPDGYSGPIHCWSGCMPTEPWWSASAGAQGNPGLGDAIRR